MKVQRLKSEAVQSVATSEFSTGEITPQERRSEAPEAQRTTVPLSGRRILPRYFLLLKQHAASRGRLVPAGASVVF